MLSEQTDSSGECCTGFMDYGRRDGPNLWISPPQVWSDCSIKEFEATYRVKKWASCTPEKGEKDFITMRKIQNIGQLSCSERCLHFYFVDILACSGNKECTELSDTCTSQICMCGMSPKCSKQTSDTCASGVCKCGTNKECENGVFCVSGFCQGK